MSCISLLKSDLKLSIILSLLDGEKKVSTLEQGSQARITTISHVLKELLEMELIVRSNGIYKLTSLGIIEAQICKNHYQAGNVLKKYKEFWLTHDISAIPPNLMITLGAIENATLIKPTDIDLHKVHNHSIQLLRSTKTILGISPIYHPDYTEAIKEILNNKGKVKLIVNHNVLEKIKQTTNNTLNKHFTDDSLQIYLNDNPKIALTLTEDKLSLGLYNLTGKYDYDNDLICEGPTAHEWGKQLFNHILNNSTKMTQTTTST